MCRLAQETDGLKRMGPLDRTIMLAVALEGALGLEKKDVCLFVFLAVCF